MTRTLLTGASVWPGKGRRRARWVLLEDGVVVVAGNGDPPAAERVVGLDGGFLVPAFRDGHAHLPSTGLQSRGANLRGAKSKNEVLERLSGLMDRAVVYGSGFEELDEPLTRTDVDALAGDRPALLSRADLHSCVVSTALLDELELRDLPGVDRDPGGDPTGFLREQAATEAWRVFDAAIPDEEQRAALLEGVRLAYSKGIAEVHEMFVVEWRGWHAAERYIETIEEVALHVPLYLGSDDVDRVYEMGLRRIGGDWFLDGSFGSHTAWLREPYESPPPAASTEVGISYRTDDEVVDLFLRAAERDMQVGVHAIGDAAIDQAVMGWETVADRLGLEAVVRGGHRIEHFECATDDHIKRAAELGLSASVQPAFDRLWGGKDGLYSSRIGWERAREMNRFATMLRAGVTIGGGSDSTVTPLDPFLALAALRSHTVAEESLAPEDALAVVTTGVAALAPGEGLRGSLDEGQRGDLAWLDRDPLEAPPDELLATEVLGTWVAGERVWPEQEAEVR